MRTGGHNSKSRPVCIDVKASRKRRGRNEASELLNLDRVCSWRRRLIGIVVRWPLRLRESTLANHSGAGGCILPPQRNDFTFLPDLLSG